MEMTLKVVKAFKDRIPTKRQSDGASWEERSRVEEEWEGRGFKGEPSMTDASGSRRTEAPGSSYVDQWVLDCVREVYRECIHALSSSVFPCAVCPELTVRPGGL